MFLIDRFIGYWIEPAIPLDKRERRRVFRLAQKQWFKDKLNFTIYILGLSISMIVFQLLSGMLERMLGGRAWHITAITFTVYIGMLLVLVYFTMRFRFSPCIYAQLRIKGFDVCPHCGYWLKDLRDDVHNCPECGTNRTPPASQIV